MKHFPLGLIALTVALTGCASLEQNGGTDNRTASAIGGGLIGCAGGALLAKVTGGNALAGCAAGAVVGGLVGFEKARQQEISAAQQASREAAAAFAPRPGAQPVRAGDVRTVEVTAVDKKTGESKKYQAFESVALDLPLAAKGTPEHDAAMAKLKTLAQRVADERGSSEIMVVMAPSDAKSRKVDLTGGTARTEKGNSILVTKTTDIAVPRGVERVIVKAGRLTTEV